MFDDLQQIFTDCLFTDAEIGQSKEPPKNAVLVEGITQNFGFHLKGWPAT